MKGIKMKNKYLEQLHNLQYHKDATAEELRVAIEVMFRKDYFEDIAGNAKNKDEHIDECLLQDENNKDDQLTLGEFVYTLCCSLIYNKPKKKK